MTGNQRRPGFRLPWSGETEEGQEQDATPSTASAVETQTTPADTSTEAASAAAAAASPGSAPDAAASASDAPASDGPGSGAPVADGTTEDQAGEPAVAESAPEPPVAAAPAAPSNGSTAEPAAPTGGESSMEFMRDLVAAMRRVADEARDTGVAELRAKAEEQVQRLEDDARKRQEQLRSRCEADVAAVGEWAKAEAERIKAEAEQRVVARRALLDQQLAADATRNEAETKALRERVSEYERELEAYHSQLAEINDPAAFAAAAKRMPRPPELVHAAATVGGTPGAQPPAGASDAMHAPAAAPKVEGGAASNGSTAKAPQVHPAEEEVLAARLAQLDAELPAESAPAPTAESTEPMTTEIVVKGLGSFGAITGFRQSLAGVEGIAGVALSLGQTGEFVFRATHAPGFDVRAAIVSLEGEGAKIEDRPEGGLRVTLERAR